MLQLFHGKSFLLPSNEFSQIIKSPRAIFRFQELILHHLVAFPEVIRSQEHMHIELPLPLHDGELRPGPPYLNSLSTSHPLQFLSHLSQVLMIRQFLASMIIKCDEAVLFDVAFESKHLGVNDFRRSLLSRIHRVLLFVVQRTADREPCGVHHFHQLSLPPVEVKLITALHQNGDHLVNETDLAFFGLVFPRFLFDTVESILIVVCQHQLS